MEFNSFESDCGPLYPIMFIDTDTFDIPAPVGLTLAEVLFEQMDERGYKVIVLEELEPASSIMSDIEIVKACKTTWRMSVTTRDRTCASRRRSSGRSTSGATAGARLYAQAERALAFGLECRRLLCR